MPEKMSLSALEHDLIFSKMYEANGQVRNPIRRKKPPRLLAGGLNFQ